MPGRPAGSETEGAVARGDGTGITALLLREGLGFPEQGDVRGRKAADRGGAPSQTQVVPGRTEMPGGEQASRRCPYTL